MNSVDLLSLIEELEEDIEDVEEDLEPVLTDSLSTTTKKLPLLDKAKLYVSVVYAIEALLFTYLRLNGVEAKEHAVFKELNRVRQYFAKIKEVENGPPKPRENMRLDKDAAGRIIKHALSGNNNPDLELRERQAREALLAKRKLRELDQKNKPSPPQQETPQPTPPEANELYLSEGEIGEDLEQIEVAPSNISSTSLGQQTSEAEDEDRAEEGKSPSRKRRKSGARNKSKKQKRKHESPS